MDYVKSLNDGANFPPQTTIATDDGEKDGGFVNGNNTRPPTTKVSNLKYAGFWIRFWAYLVDLIVIGSINRLLVDPIFMLFDGQLYEASVFTPISIVSAIVFYSYFVFMTKFFGQTLGKMVFGLRVIDLEGKRLAWSTVLFREWIGRFISKTILITYAIVGFMPKKQGLHDLFADTIVIHENGK